MSRITTVTQASAVFPGSRVSRRWCDVRVRACVCGWVGMSRVAGVVERGVSWAAGTPGVLESVQSFSFSQFCRSVPSRPRDSVTNRQDFLLPGNNHQQLITILFIVEQVFTFISSRQFFRHLIVDKITTVVILEFI